MTKDKVISLVLCGTLLLTIGLAPKPARADSGSGEDSAPIRLYATAYPGPIGTVAATALVDGGLTVNGRAASDGQAVWSGDLIQSGSVSRATVSLDSIGALTLSKGSSVRVATKPVKLDDGSRRFVLIASLDRGEIGVTLEPTASAYLRVASSTYSSSEGASFLATASQGHASIAVKAGDVRAEQQPAQHEYKIRPVGHDSNITVPVRGVRQIQVEVLEDDRPVPDIGVSFVLDTTGALPGRLGMGTLTNTNLNVVTNANGIAALHFVAGDDAGTVPIVATIEGTRVSWSGVITVKASRGPSKNMGWTIAALLGAGAAAGIAFALSREDKGTLQAQPPEVKNP
ncbi:MAG TPA: hypothetical protein VLM38_18275 [Blastocatellia bacterium]|nr:hypothetical protein [Blastocatellia bacterium]